jgi:hypothetical protein
MEEATRVNGKMVSKMGMARLRHQITRKGEGFGKKARG